jgi:hypothetical protein
LKQNHDNQTSISVSILCVSAVAVIAVNQSRAAALPAATIRRRRRRPFVSMATETGSIVASGTLQTPTASVDADPSSSKPVLDLMLGIALTGI